MVNVGGQAERRRAERRLRKRHPRGDASDQNGLEDKTIYDKAGVSALRPTISQPRGNTCSALSDLGEIDKGAARRTLSETDQYQKFWEKEEPIRKAEAEADNLPRVKLATNKGDIVVELFENQAPIATANFISLVEKHAYDGTKFHRVLPGFMAQGAIRRQQARRHRDTPFPVNRIATTTASISRQPERSSLGRLEQRRIGSFRPLFHPQA